MYIRKSPQRRGIDAANMLAHTDAGRPPARQSNQSTIVSNMIAELELFSRTSIPSSDEGSSSFWKVATASSPAAAGTGSTHEGVRGTST